MSTNMLAMGTPTSIPTTAISTAMAIFIRTNTTTSIITATNTTLNHIITITGTRNTTDIMSANTPTRHRRFVSIRSKQ